MATVLRNQETGEFIMAFDGNLEEKHSRSAKISSYPRENASDASDHHQALQRKFELLAIVTNHPLGGEYSEFHTLNAMSDVDDLITTGVVMSGTSDLVFYENLQLEGYTTKRDHKTGESLPITLTFVQIDESRSQTTQVPDNILAALRRASGKGKSKKVDTAKQATAQEEEKVRGSNLYKNKDTIDQVVDTVGNLFN